MPRESGFSVNEFIALAFFFAVSYLIQYLISISSSFINTIPILDVILTLRVWESPNYFIMPLVAFVFVVYGIIYAEERFEFKSLMKWFPVIFIVLTLAAFYANMAFFFMPLGNPNAGVFICMEFDCSSTTSSLQTLYSAQGIQLSVFQFWPTLRSTSFSYFILSGLMAWLSLLLTRHLKSRKLI